MYYEQQPQQPYKSRLVGLRKIILRIMATLVILTCSLGAFTLTSAYVLFKNPNIKMKNTPALWTPPPGYTYGPGPTPMFNEKCVTMLFIGVDTSKNRSIDKYGYQADVLIMMVLYTDTNKITMVSIPRDTLVDINRLNSKGQIIGTVRKKINAAFSYGFGINKYSCQNTVAAVERLFGVPINDYAAIDMDGVGPITEAIGGVPLVIDADYSAFGMPKGSTQNLMGEKALTYVRQRHLPGTGGSDVERTKRQIRFVKAFMTKVKSMNPLQALSDLYNPLKKYIKSNMSFERMAQYASYLNRIDFENGITSASVEGYGDEEGNWIYYEEKLYMLRQELFFR